MNTYTLNLSSSTATHVGVAPLTHFDDRTELSLTFIDMYEGVVPISMRIDWGDGDIDFYDNNIDQQDVKLVNTFNVSPLFLATYNHTYYPSSTSLYKSIYCQILVTYSNYDQSWHTIPIQIRTYDYFESVYDLKLINTNILPYNNNPKQHQLLTDIGNFLIEVRTD